MAEYNKENYKIETDSRQDIKKKQSAIQTRCPLKTLNQNVDNILAGPSWKINTEENKEIDCKIKLQVEDHKLGPTEDAVDNVTPCNREHILGGNFLQTFSCRGSETAIFCVAPTVDSVQYIDESRYATSHSNDIIYTEEILNYLLSFEKKTEGWESRKYLVQRMINWMIEINRSPGCATVIERACWFLDTCLASNGYGLTFNRLHKIAAACFWIADKEFNGCSYNASKLVAKALIPNAFTNKSLYATEINILKKMEFKLRPVVPYDFVPYLTSCCSMKDNEEITLAAIFLCQCGIIVKKISTAEYPSVVASAAVLTAHLLLKKNACVEILRANIVYKAAVRKAGNNLNATCLKLRDAVKEVASAGYHCKAPLLKLNYPPHFITRKIVAALGR